MVCGPSKGKNLVSWEPPPLGSLKLNVDCVAIGKTSPTPIGVLQNWKGNFYSCSSASTLG